LCHRDKLVRIVLPNPLAPLTHRLDELSRAAALEGARLMAPQLLGAVPFGLVAGVASVAGGLTPFEAIALSFVVYSGVAQLAIVQLLAVQAPLVVVLLAASVISLRLIMYSAAVAPQFVGRSLTWRWFIASHLTDQALALMSARASDKPSDPHVHWFYVGAVIPMFIVWQAAVAIGALVGSQIPATWSLDFAVTLSFVVLLKPAIKKNADLLAALAAILVSLIAIGMPYRLALVVATFCGIVVGMIGDNLLQAREAKR
jgi:4-azaleucine resistance transporter AzlC